jgi:hypothetical protein
MNRREFFLIQTRMIRQVTVEEAESMTDWRLTTME